MVNRKTGAGSAPARLDALDRSLAIIELSMDGVILDANQNFLDLFAYGKHELIGQHHRMFVSATDATGEAYDRFWQELKQGHFQAAAYKRLGKGGREIWIQATYNPILNRRGDAVGIVKLATDVTEQKLRTIDHAGEITAIRKSQGVMSFSTDGIILDANRNILDALGYALADIQGRHHRVLVEPDVARSWDYTDFWARLARGEFQQAEFRRRGKDGREVWIQATYNPIIGPEGEVVRVVKFATDVTDEKRMRAASGSQIDAISRSHGVAHFDLDGLLLDANDNFLDTMGYRIGEVRGKHHEMFVERAFAATREYQDFWRNLRRGEYVSAIFERVGKNGRPVAIQATYSPILDASGRPFKIVKYTVDVTGNIASRNRAVQATAQTLMTVRSMTLAAGAMSTSVAGVAEAMNRSKSAVDEIHDKARSADKSTDTLRGATEALDGVVQTITKIAEQINLLALNATIEAMRAGQAGKGFAIVANEVKSLATQATVATARISEEIAAMQAVSGNVADTLASISTAIGSVQRFVTQATAAVETQREATREMTDRMQAANGDIESIGESLTAWR
ncbi:PAS domain-containing methyl-accepting chemotaxis protein [Methylobacterium crusticola]|nr:PAS domain-containing methyl-accepting chemotaxis protein [Methylobacterium crusticola]